MKSFVIAVTLCCALGVQAQQVSESIDVSVVEVDVVILDKAGKPVSGLSRDDFELLVDGRPHAISNFYAAEPAIGSAMPPNQQNAESQDQRRTYVTVFADLSHLRQQGLRQSLEAVREFAKTLPPNAAMQLVSWNGSLAIEKPFGGEKTIESAIEDLIGRPGGGVARDQRRRDLLYLIDQSHTPAGGQLERRGTMLDEDKIADEVRNFARQERNLADATIEALGEVARSSAGLPGRRILIYLSDGLPTQPGLELFDYNHLAGIDTGEFDVTPKVKKMARDASAEGVMIYAVDASGLRNREETGIEHGAYQSRVDSTLARFNNQSALQSIAEETGGRAIMNTNDMVGAFGELRAHATTYYSIGFRGDGSSTLHDVQVNVRKPGFTVRSPRSFREHTQEEDVTARVRASLYSREQVNPLDARIGLAASGKKPAINLIVSVPQDKLASIPGMTSGFDLYICILDDKLRESEVKKLHRDVLITSDGIRPMSIPAEPGPYVLSIAIVDSLTREASYLQHEVIVTPSNEKNSAQSGG